MPIISPSPSTATLKSTALTIGSQDLSDKAKALELAGNECFSSTATPEDKEKNIAYVRAHHAAVMELYR
ncbi:MAG: hypothetical protein IJ849_00070 [Selenomonadaceae bacterium]|nr:hypothetical protein [Selenomonadaceae bacterium]